MLSRAQEGNSLIVWFEKANRILDGGLSNKNAHNVLKINYLIVLYTKFKAAEFIALKR